MARWMGLAADWLRPSMSRSAPGSWPEDTFKLRTTLAIFHGPAFQDNACFVQIAEEFAVAALIAQLVIKALNVSVLQGLPGLM
jgi:hypothetical protein